MISGDGFDVGFGIVWISGCLLSTLTLLWSWHAPARDRRLESLRLNVPCILLIAVAARLVPMLVLNRGAIYDITSYHIIGRLALTGKDVYTARAAQGRYPYLPMDLWLSAGALFSSQLLHVPFVVMVKLPAVLADVAISGLIILGARRRNKNHRSALTAGLLYAVNPVSVLVTAYHGQFDAIPLLACIAAWYRIESEGRDIKRSAAITIGLVLGLAILAKPWPLLLLPAYVIAVRGWMDRLGVVAFALAVPAVVTTGYVFAYHVPVHAVAINVLGYGSVLNWWGVGLLFHLTQATTHLISPSGVFLFSKLTEIAIVSTCAAYLIRARTRDLVTCILTLLLIFYVMSAGFSVQYLMWILPFLCVTQTTRKVLASTFLSLTTCAMLVAYMVDGLMYRAVAGYAGSTLADVPFFLVYGAVVWWLVTRVPQSSNSTPQRGLSGLGLGSDPLLSNSSGTASGDLRASAPARNEHLIPALRSKVADQDRQEPRRVGNFRCLDLYATIRRSQPICPIDIERTRPHLITQTPIARDDVWARTGHPRLAVPERLRRLWRSRTSAYPRQRALSRYSPSALSGGGSYSTVESNSREKQV